jgi:hypothetical protein
MIENRLQARVFADGARWFAVVVCVDDDGSEHRDRGWEGRYFSTRDAAIRRTGKYIANNGGRFGMERRCESEGGVKVNSGTFESSPVPVRTR